MVDIPSRAFHIIKNLIYQYYVAILNLEISNNLISKYIKQNFSELQGKIKKSTVILADYKTPLSVIDKTKTNKQNQ